MTQFCIEEAVLYRSSMLERRHGLGDVESESEEPAGMTPALHEALAKARHFAQTGEKP